MSLLGQAASNRMKKEGSEKSVISQSNKYDGVGYAMSDLRFSTNHRFQKLPKQKSKVVIDSRFEQLFTGKRFASSSASCDKRGKRIPRRPKTAKNKFDTNHPLCRYYRLEGQKPKVSDQESDDDSEEKESHSDSDDDHNDVSMESDDQEECDEEDSTDDDKDAFVENVPVTEEITHRLAIVNMDWRHFKAVDLYEVLSANLPKGGLINSVAVYPTEFGSKRMEEEAHHGPIPLFGEDKCQNDEDSDDEIDEEKLRAYEQSITRKLRAYEQSKLRYYIAVVDCDSSATANHLYESCDGVEFERSSNMFDLRFIPDGMEFKHPRDIATERASNYKGLDFYSKQLQHSEVNLTWDEDEPHRTKILNRKFTKDQLDELEFKEFLASDDSEVEENENDGTNENEKKDRCRALLLSGSDSDKDSEDEGQDMEVTFNTGLEYLCNRIQEKKDRKSETVWDAFLRKQKEKKSSMKNKSKISSKKESSDDAGEPIEQEDDFLIEEPSFKKNRATRSKSNKKEKQQMDKDSEASRAELELLLADDTGAKTTNLKGYNLKRKRAKGKKENHVPEEKLPTAESDTRFSALLTSPKFALDRTDPNFIRTRAYLLQQAMKQQKKWEIETNQASDNSEAKAQEKCELSSMVKSIKMKSKQLRDWRLKKHTNRLKCNDLNRGMPISVTD